MKKRTIALGLRNYNYGELYIFAQSIHDGVQSKPALFPSPVPPLAVFQASINTMRDALDAWGNRGSLGGNPEKFALLEAREILREHLKSCARYVMTAQPGNPQSWTDVGFVLKALPAKTGLMEPVQNFHQFIARNIRQGDVKLKWARPLGAHPATMITYKVLRSADEHFANAFLVGTTMNKATFTDTPPAAGVLFYYWVIPVTAAGEGARSEMCRGFASPV